MNIEYFLSFLFFFLSFFTLEHSSNELCLMTDNAVSRDKIMKKHMYRMFFRIIKEAIYISPDADIIITFTLAIVL